jgi:long-subunit fatty acid transport protein
LGAIASVLIGVGSLPCAAQSSLQVPIQFDFLSPGARSLGFGSAFVGLADDATASWTNPAGLLEIVKPEFSFEGRYRRVTQPFLVGGRLSGTVTMNLQDTVAGPEFTDVDDTSFRPAFMSFVYPHKRWRFALYRHEPLRIGQSFNSRGVFQSRGTTPFDDFRDTGFSGQRTITISSYGFSAAGQWRKLWLGGGVSLNRFSLDFDFNRFVTDPLAFYGPPETRFKVFEFSQTGDATSLGVVAGIMAPLGTNTKVGGAYRRTSPFPFSSVSQPTADAAQTSTAEFRAPDTIAVGLSQKAFGQTATVTAEYKRVFYSQLRSDYVVALVSQGESRSRSDRFTIDDANEIHLGGEYIVPISLAPSVRGGVWFEPDHSVHYAPTAAFDILDELIDASLSSGRDQWHYTVGASIGLGPVELSVGADHSARTFTVSSSAIIRLR